MRGLRRRLPGSFLALALGVLSSAAASATTFPVTKTADTADGTCDADCSLREAVIAANANPGPDMITLPAGTYNLSIAGTDAVSAVGDLDITGELIIFGAGAATTIIDAQDLDRVLEILGGPVTISGVTFRNGTSFAGGGIFINSTTAVNLNNVVVTGNVSTSGGGGGIRSTGVLTLTESTVSNNITNNQQGAGIMALNTTTITRSTISGNSTGTSGGGGIFVLNINLTITNSTISGNSAGSGGGLANTTNVANNIAISNTTITGNVATSTGGGIVTGAPGVVTLTGTILAGNSASTSPDCGDAITSGGFNLIQNTSGCTITGTTTGNITGQNAQLAALATNGGPTQTHALLGSSPALNAFTSGCPPPPTDQRNISRPQQTACEIGSFECQTTIECGGVVQTATPTPTPTPTQPGATATPTRTNTVPPTSTPTTIPQGAPADVPTLSFPMLALLGLALAGAAMLLIRRL